ncbi:hypothetical protein WS68_08415 [Burkholderia sp. TSV86]|nr:hypothetical protein WS68_08415 [Burkholderia sp. TSV86]
MPPQRQRRGRARRRYERLRRGGRHADDAGVLAHGRAPRGHRLGRISGRRFPSAGVPAAAPHALTGAAQAGVCGAFPHAPKFLLRLP